VGAYMGVVANNYTAILADTDISSLLADTTNTTDMKTIIGAHMISKYRNNQYFNTLR
jgi:hypothetical protein